MFFSRKEPVAISYLSGVEQRSVNPIRGIILTLAKAVCSIPWCQIAGPVPI